MKIKTSKSMLRFIGMVVLIGLTATVSGKPETCEQCKFVDCLRGTIKRNEALIAMYGKLATQFSRAWKQDGKAIDVIDFSSINEGSKGSTYSTLVGTFKNFNDAVDHDSETLPEATACGYTSPIEVDTDSLETCKIGVQLQSAEQQMPCLQLAQAILKHEDFHSQACKARQNPTTSYWKYTVNGANGKSVSKYLPPKILTPAGLAKEEIAAYKKENEALQKTLKAAEAQCKRYKFEAASFDCIIPDKTARSWKYSISGEVDGDPATSKWRFNESTVAEAKGKTFTAHAPPTVSGGCGSKNDPVSQMMLQAYRAAGMGGPVCFFERGEEPKVELHLVLPKQCTKSGEQIVTRKLEVDSQRSPTKDEQDPQSKPIS